MKSDKTFKSEKNRTIAETYAATKERRSHQVLVQIDLKVKYGKKYNMPQEQIDFFNNVFIEAKRFKNHLLNLSSKPYESDDEFIEIITDEHAKYLAEHPYKESFESGNNPSSKEETLDLFHTN